MHVEINRRSAVTVLIACALLLATLGGALSAASSSSVIVQAASVEDAAAEVRANGGYITAEVSIINAVVAEVPSGSVDCLAETPGVIRVTMDRPARKAGDGVDV